MGYMMGLFDFMSDLDWEPFLRMALAIVLGGLIGLEREFSGRPAGLRTHILVCMGATIIVLASTAVPRLFDSSYQETLRIDPGRIAAGIVTGIGFLGAGAIIRTGEFVRGLTTASCIWFAAGLGIVIGVGFYGIAICSTVLVLLVLRIDVLIETHIRSPIYRTLTARIANSESERFQKKCIALLKKNRIRIQDLHCSYDKESDFIELKFFIRVRQNLQSRDIIDGLRQDEPGLTSVGWQE